MKILKFSKSWVRQWKLTLMDTPPPILTLIFSLLCVPLLIIRNIYYFRLWQQRESIPEKNLLVTIFPKGMRKFINPIHIGKQIADASFSVILKRVNLYSYFCIVSFLIAFLSLFLHFIKYGLWNLFFHLLLQLFLISFYSSGLGIVIRLLKRELIFLNS